MNIIDIIAKKRDGFRLSDEEIDFFVQGYVKGTVADYQASALLMAIYLRGMDKEETLSLTLSMLNSGDRMDLSSIPGHKIDKHSTGGVGDKTTLIAAPIAAACGVTVAKMTGRGLGHTGGTVDKLESVKGLSCNASFEQFLYNSKENGITVTGQTGDLAPADKKLYALRDVTATVANIPLIASSVMSKKLASGADGLVLDVKYGSGAFMPDKDSAEELAKCMLEIAEGAGLKARALITDMNTPLGSNVGNICELEEAQNILKTGEGEERLTEISLNIAANMIDLAFDCGIDEALRRAKAALIDGSAYDKFCTVLISQGGDPDTVRNMTYGEATETAEITAERDGYICKNDALLVGRACCSLGAGRLKKTDEIDSTAGITVIKPYGSYVRKGDVIALLYNSDKNKLNDAIELYRSSVEYSDTEPQKRETIYKVLAY